MKAVQPFCPDFRHMVLGHIACLRSELVRISDTQKFLCFKCYRYPKVHWFVPSGVKSWFRSSGIPDDRVSEMVWWQEANLPSHDDDKAEKMTKVIFTPSNHWSRRSATDENKSLWGSWTVVGKKVCTNFLVLSRIFSYL